MGAVEDALAAVLEAKLTPIRAEVGRLAAGIEAMRRALPPLLVSATEAARTLGLSLSTVRRRLREGTLPSKRIGSRLLVDLGALHGPMPGEVLQLVRQAKRG